MGAKLLGAAVGLYLAAWAYVEVRVLTLAAPSGGPLLLGILGSIGLVSGGLGLAWFGRIVGGAARRPLLLGVPLTVILYLLVDNAGPAGAAMAYPLMAIIAALVSSTVGLVVVDTTPSEAWPRALSNYRAWSVLWRLLGLASILVLSGVVPHHIVVAALLSLVAPIAAVSMHPAVIPSRLLYKLDRWIDSVTVNLVTMGRIPVRGWRRSTKPLVMAAFGAAGAASGIRYQLTPLVGELPLAGLVSVLVLYSAGHLVGSMIGSSRPSPLAPVAATLMLAPLMDHVDPSLGLAFAVLGFVIGYTEQAVLLKALEWDPDHISRTSIATYFAASVAVILVGLAELLLGRGSYWATAASIALFGAIGYTLLSYRRPSWD